jgi:DNA-binding winged helix-turn-helix (wHTH) protein
MPLIEPESLPGSQDEPKYRFGVFEADMRTRELRRSGVRVRVHAQPFQILALLLARPGELVTREEIAGVLWPEGTFVDFEHGVNSAVNRLREALGDTANQPRYVETLSRRGYRFLAPVERIEAGVPSTENEPAVEGFGILAMEAELPAASPQLVRALFVLLQVMYLGFYVGALANLGEIEELVSVLPKELPVMTVLIVTAAVLIPMRAFLLMATAFGAPGMRRKFLRLWPVLLPMDVLWALSPFLLLHHINFGLALACAALLVYSPFAQRGLVLMGGRHEAGQ